jgi:hypothetical protein
MHIFAADIPFGIAGWRLLTANHARLLTGG